MMLSSLAFRFDIESLQKAFYDYCESLSVGEFAGILSGYIIFFSFKTSRNPRLWSTHFFFVRSTIYLYPIRIWYDLV